MGGLYGLEHQSLDLQADLTWVPYQAAGFKPHIQLICYQQDIYSSPQPEAGFIHFE
jgi:hypothetical protein